MPTALVIGASQGLGLEWVKYYKNLGYNVIATTTNPEQALELKQLLVGNTDKVLKMDVTDLGSVNSAMTQLEEAPDITIYNSGVKGYTKSPNVRATLLNAELISGEASSREAGRRLAYEVNAYGFDRVMFELKDKLLKKLRATVMKVSSGVAPAGENTGGGYPFYRDSKTAGDNLARGWDIDLGNEAKDIDSRPRIFSLIPGLVDSGMGKGIAGAADPKTRIAEMAKVIESVRASGDTHGLWDYKGAKLEEYEIPDYLIKWYRAINSKDAVRFLVSVGRYKTKKTLIDQGTQTDEVKPAYLEVAKVNK